MSLTKIDAATMRRVFISGANNISNNKEYINELNVFPVPDGDTGTNMTLTIMAAASEAESIANPTISSVAKAISSGSLRGARGNSGVILSQLFRGFYKDVKGKTELSVEDLTSAFARAVDTAYKAVMKPKEGTILTVAKAMADIASDLLSTEEEIIPFVEKVVEHGEEVLQKTPDMLPVLKEAGVVDSGGQGLIDIFKGIVLGLKGEDVTLNEGPSETPLARGAGVLDDIPKARPSFRMGSGKEDISTADIKFGYCTEFIILLDKELTSKQVDDIKKYLLSIGDSLVCVADEELVKIHVHTNHPGRAFEKALEYGQLTRCKVDNMREEHSERVSIENEKLRAAEQDKAFKQMKAERTAAKKADESMTQSESDIKSDSSATPDSESTVETTQAEVKSEPEAFGFIAVSTGEGLNDIFTEIGVNKVIYGGQTMNPSTDDILNAANEVNAKDIFVFPNNKNIILAAQQAGRLCKDKTVHVIASATIPQGIAAMISFDGSKTPEENEEIMNEAMSEVKSGEITYAVRDTQIDGKEIHKDDIMGISDKGIEVIGNDVDAVLFDLIDSLVDEDSGLISVYYGEDISEEKASVIGDQLAEKYEDLDVEIKSGGQSIYYYILSVE